MWILVEHAPVRADVTALDVLLFANGRHPTRRQPGGARADQLGQAATQFELGFGSFDVEVLLEQVPRLHEVLVRVFFDLAEEGGVEGVRGLQGGDVLALEDLDGLVLVQVDDGQAPQLAEIQARDHLLEGLLARSRRVAVDDDVVGRSRQDDVLVVKGPVLAVDSDGHVGGEVEVRDLGDGSAVFHVGGVAARAEDAADAHRVVGVGGGDQRAGRVVDERGQLDGQAARGEGGFEERDDVVAFDAFDVETLGPALQHAVVNVVLLRGVGKGEAEGDGVQVLVFVVVLDELLQAVGNVFPELVRLAGLELFGHAVFGLDNVELAFFFGQDDFADAEIRAAHVEGEEGAGFVACWVAHNPGWVHRLDSELLLAHHSCEPPGRRGSLCYRLQH